MDFRVVDNLVCSNSSTAASNNGGSLASETDADVNDLTLYGYAFLSRERTAAEDDPPASETAKISSRGGEMAKVSLQESNNGGGFTQPHQQMLSFSAYHAPPLPFPFVRTSSGYGSGGINGTSVCGVNGPFTASQWMELEHQALIYKYITANVPIPSSLLIPIRKAFESSGFSCFSLLRPNALGWGGFHLGFSKNDPEPGRCRRTDGKKWRCSRDAVADQKYCERHMNRGRHRSRKPVEGGTTTTPNASSPAPLLHHHQQTNNHSSAKRCPTDKESTPAKKICSKNNQHNAYTQSEFGSVCSDSLLNPLNRSSSHALRHFIDEWPKSHSDLKSCTAFPTNEKLDNSPPPSLSREFEATQMGLGVGYVHSEQSQRHSSWVPISWEPSVGGPLGEALHNKALNLMETRLPSSPLGAHRGAFVGTSPGSESKTLDGASFCNGLIGPGLMLPSLPAL